MRACTLYSCQVATEKLSRTAVVERAAQLADAEGLDAVTIRRLAQELGVTPMALYWHFKNKDELLLGLADHLLARVRADRRSTDPWLDQIRAMVEALVAIMREHPSLPTLLMAVEKDGSAAFNRATNDALELLGRGGFSVEESFWVAMYLLEGMAGLVQGKPGIPPSTLGPAEADEWRRQKRLALEALSPQDYPMIQAYAATLREPVDADRYFAFGIDLLMAGVKAQAPKPSD
jgi:TetR/AcrR family transcriptional regulator, tetracycline repressor protein